MGRNAPLFLIEKTDSVNFWIPVKGSGSVSKVTDIAARLAQPIVEENGCSLWDVEYVKEAGGWFLRLYIDKEGGVSIDDCEAVSRGVDPLLDEADPIEQSYYLEVGSPGLGRRLTRDEHFARYLGEKVAVRLIRPDESGRRDYEGILKAKEGPDVTVETENGPITFALAAASSVKLCDDEDLF